MSFSSITMVYCLYNLRNGSCKPCFNFRWLLSFFVNFLSLPSSSIWKIMYQFRGNFYTTDTNVNSFEYVFFWRISIMIPIVGCTSLHSNQQWMRVPSPRPSPPRHNFASFCCHWFSLFLRFVFISFTWAFYLHISLCTTLCNTSKGQKGCQIS